VVQLDFLGVNDGGTVGVEVEGTGRGSLPNTTADWGSEDHYHLLQRENE